MSTQVALREETKKMGIKERTREGLVEKETQSATKYLKGTKPSNTTSVHLKKIPQILYSVEWCI